MPNRTPQEWTEQAHLAARPICANGGCVDIDEVDGGFLFTSTIEGNEGHVLYTPAETAAFLDAVKAGTWDHVHRAAKAAAGAELLTA